ncbi:MAG: HEAT repeat domain-containing protein [Thiolinea sp.]
MSNFLLNYRGRIQALSTQNNQLLFATTHPEKQATALYRLSLDGRLTEAKSFALDQLSLPCGVYDLSQDGENTLLAGQDGKLYQVKGFKGAAKALAKLDFADDPVLQIRRLTDGYTALLQRKQLALLNTKNQLIQQINLSDNHGTVIATDPGGQWLALGKQNGEIAAYQLDNGELQFSAKAQIHQGRVSAIAFEHNELRFYSAGADKKLYNTHAQGELQPLDKGKSSNHDSIINDILMGETRFFTGANDKSIKAWAHSGGRPVTVNKGLGKVTLLATIEREDKTILVAACGDNTLRLLPLTSGGEPNEVQVVLRDAYAWAQNLLADKDPKYNEAALKTLAQYNDQKSFELLSRTLQQSHNKALRQQIIDIACQSAHPESGKLLESALNDKQHDVVRLAAFDGLVKRIQNHSIRPYTLALDTGYVDIGTQALNALTKLAKKQTQAEQALISALNHKQRSLRLLALSLLEGIYKKTDPKASLHALQLSQPELQRAALIRLFQRKLLNNSEAQRAILLAQENKDSWVRRTAFLVSILSQNKLTQALKNREPDLARQLQEIEDFDLLKAEDNSKAVNSGNAASKSNSDSASNADKADGSLVSNAVQRLKNLKANLTGADSTKTKAADPAELKKLQHADYAPLLQGMTSQHADICFTAGFALAVLQDQRAFGLLLLLSQEQDQQIRVGVCRAFALLQQQDAVQQLEALLNDPVEAVRDAAFSALENLLAEPWALVRYGFAAQHEDVHRRALKTLLDNLGKGQNIAQEGLTLITQALNAPFDAIRQEAFKVSLNRQLGGDQPATLRLLLNSQYENIHQEVLNETLAALKEEWATTLLPELFADNFAAVRKEALQQALKEKKRFNRHEVLAQAVTSPFEDIRREVLQQAAKKPTSKDQLLLETLLQDEVRELRLAALQSIMLTGNTETLEQALSSDYEDIRTQAAIACAQLGLAQAYQPLLDLILREKPEDKKQHEQWRNNVIYGLQGLGLLEDNNAFEHIIPYLHNSNDKLATEAAQILPWISNTEHTATLTELLSHERIYVRANAANALTLLGNERGRDALRDDKLRATLNPQTQLAATLASPSVSTQALRDSLRNPAVSNTSVLALFSHEFLLHGKQPELSLRALALDMPSLQRRCADVISLYHDDTARWDYLQSWFSRLLVRDDKQEWQIDSTTLRQIAAILVHGQPRLRARLINFISVIALDGRGGKALWENHYTAFRQRYADAIAQAEAQAKPQTATSKDQPQRWQLAFGAYLGLLRAEHENGHYAATMNLRTQAMQGLKRLAQQGNKTLHQGVVSCLLTLLNHDHYAIRHKAFDDLIELEVAFDTLGNAATTSRHDDIAADGLQLLVKHYPLKKSQNLLQDVMITGSPVLANEAYELLLGDDADEEAQTDNLLKIAPLAIQSYTTSIGRRCIAHLGEYYKRKGVVEILLEACKNPARKIAEKAFYLLTENQHPQSLAVLENLWHSSESEREQQALLNTCGKWQGDGMASVLLTFTQHRDTLKIAAEYVYYRIGQTRETSAADTLLERLQQKDASRKVINAMNQALLCISGYDQHIPYDLSDEEEEPTDRSWLAKQHTRHDAITIRHFTTLVKTDQHQYAQAMLDNLAWMTANPTVDQALLDASHVANADFLEDLLQTIALRSRRREGSVEALLQQLQHKEAEIQFLAAEGLGRSGHTQGNNVLLASMEFLDDLEQRERAVIALGESGDSNVLDKLLDLAEDKEHALNEAAIEAIGHLGQSEHAEKILKLMQQALKNADAWSDMNERALSGLRWFNTLASWQTLCEFISNDNSYSSSRGFALKLLRHWDTEFSREILLKTLRENDDWDEVEIAFDSATYLWQPPGDQVSEIDLAFMQGHFAGSHQYFGDEKILQRVLNYANTEQLLDLLSGNMKLDDEVISSQLQRALLQRDDHQPEDIAKGLAAERSETVGIIAHLASLMPTPVKQVQTALQHALEAQLTRWDEIRTQAQREANRTGYNPHYQLVQQQLISQQNAVNKLLRAAIVQQVKSPLITDTLCSSESSRQLFHEPILQALLRVEKCADKALLAAVHELLSSPSFTLRKLAQQAIRQHGNAKDQAGMEWESFLHQPKALAEKNFAPALMNAAESERQARALPILISQQNVAVLEAIAHNTSADETRRIGAIEGLGRMRSPEAEDCLQALHQQEGIDADIARAAFRALRRSQRARQKASNDNDSQGAAA